MADLSWRNPTPGWEDPYNVKVSDNILGPLTPAAPGTYPEFFNMVGRGLAGFGGSFMNPPNVPPMEVLSRGPLPDIGGARQAVSPGAPASPSPWNPIPADAGAPKASIALGTPAPAPAQQTVSSAVASNTLDLGKRNEWYQGLVQNFGFHPDFNSQEHNKNLDELFSKGATAGFDAKRNPIFILPDGKTIPMNPNTFAMVKTPEQITQMHFGAPYAGAQQAQPQAAPSVAAAPVAAPQNAQPSQMLNPVQPAPTAAAPAPDIQAPPGPSLAPPTLPVQAAAPALAPGEPAAPAVAPRPADEFAGRLMTAGGIIASALDPQRFSQAGQMLASAGQGELTRERADAAARLAGYPTEAALKAAGAASAIRKQAADTGLDIARTEYNRGLTANLPFHGQLTKAEADYKTEQAYQARQMRPISYTLPGGGSLMVDPKTYLNAMHNQQTTILEHLRLAEQSANNEVSRKWHLAQIAQLSERLPYPGAPNGLPMSAWATLKAAEGRGLTAEEVQWQHKSDAVDKIIKEEKDRAGYGLSAKFSPGTRDRLKVIANQFLTNPAWRWKGISIYAELQELPPTKQASTSGPTTPTLSELKAEKARRAGAK